MPLGYFSLILHAHLPFVRHPEYPEFLEEDWLYEAITEVYLPLIFIFQSLHESGASPRLAINISPPLCEMLADELLQTRYTAHLENLIELAKKEEIRTRDEAAEFHDVAQMYVENLTASHALWNDRYGRNLLNAFRELNDEGVIEIITCAATHGFLPLISTPEAKNAQIEIAVKNYRKHFGRQPRGIWLAECAYEKGAENLLKAHGIEYFVSDTHAILYGDPRPKYGVHAPVVCPNGVAVFARDVDTSQQVWSAESGYPGNELYREFYRDIGWDAPLEYLLPHLHSDGGRRHLGVKYHQGAPRRIENFPTSLRSPDSGRQATPRISSANGSTRRGNFAKLSKAIRRSSSRHTMPNSMDIGGTRARSFLISSSRKCISTRMTSGASRPATFSIPTCRSRFRNLLHRPGENPGITKFGSTKEIRGCTRISMTPNVE